MKATHTALTHARYIGRLFGMLLFACALSGCIDYDEEMWLNSDLSGRVTMAISVREELVKGATGLERDTSEDGLRRDLERIPGVKLESYESFRDAGKVHAKLGIRFDSLEKLTRHESNPADSSALSLLGSITVHEEHGKVVLERALRAMPETRSGSMGKDILAQSLGSLFFSNNYLTYKLHVPAELITANSQRVDGPDRTVEWKYTLAQAIREPPVMHVEWKKRVLTSWMAALVAVIGVAGALLWWRGRRNASLVLTLAMEISLFFPHGSRNRSICGESRLSEKIPRVSSNRA